MTGRRAFTLVEMIVALAVTSVLTVLMLRMFTDSSTIWKREDERLDTFREARAALQLMASELSTVNPVPNVPPLGSDGNEQFPALALHYHNETPDAEKSAPGNQEIYALTNRPSPRKSNPATRDKSDLCAIGYFCEWKQEKTELSDTKNCYILRRQFADSDTTFSRLQQVLKAGAPMKYPDSFNTLYSRAQGNPDASTAAPPVQDLASYVWDLQFTLSPPTPTSTPIPWPPKPESYARDLPQWVEIRFKALGSAAARKLAGQNLTRAMWFRKENPTYQRFILPNEQQFVTRVKLSR